MAAAAALASPWAVVPMIAGIGLNLWGSKEASEAQVAGTKAQAKIETLNRQYQNQKFLEGIEKQKPFYEAGTQALKEYRAMTTGPEAQGVGGIIKERHETTTSGLGAMQRRLLEGETSGMSKFVKESVFGQLEAEETEKKKARLIDMIQIGLGSAGAAGQARAGLGTALAQSYQREGSANIQGQLAQMIGRQNMWVTALEGLSGIPAALAASRGRTPTAQSQPIYQQSPQPQGYGTPMGDGQQYGVYA